MSEPKNTTCNINSFETYNMNNNISTTGSFVYDHMMSQKFIITEKKELSLLQSVLVASKIGTNKRRFNGILLIELISL